VPFVQAPRPQLRPITSFSFISPLEAAMRLGLATEGRECCSWLAGQMKNNGVVLLTIRIIWRCKKMQVDDVTIA
jgi:hypothetical protein